MRLISTFYILLCIIVVGSLVTGSSGCAQIGAPTGGPKDTLSPVLTSALPPSNTTNFTGNKIILNFNEYVEVKDVQTNVLVSPLLKSTPNINYKFKTVTIKIKDTLKPNTTYAIDFGDAIQDVNESNPLRNFTYVFSTGSTIDSLTLKGKLKLAESGDTDSTMIVMLYRNADDSAVLKRRPDYVARLKGNGSFQFNNLPYDDFKIYALKDGDGGKTYNAKSELFAFADKPVTVKLNTDSITLYAYAEEKEKNKQPVATKNTEKKLRYTASTGQQELLENYTITFNKPLKKFDVAKIILADTNYIAVTDVNISLDSTHTKIVFANQWKEGEQYRIILDKEAFSDSADNAIAKTDTLKIIAKKEADYGNVVLRFNNADLSKHLIIQFVQGEVIKESHAITGKEFRKKLFNPGEYNIRLLYDENNNGTWDPGNYAQKKQPEKVIALSQKLLVRANWDNEADIKF